MMDDPKSDLPETGHYWLSVSDLMSAMVFILLACFLAYSLSFQRERLDFRMKETELTRSPRAQHELLATLNRALRENGIASEVAEAEGVIRLHDDAVAFPMAKAYPDLPYRQNLAKIGEILVRVLSCYTSEPAKLPPSTAGLQEHCSVPVRLDALQACPASSATTKIASLMIEGHTDAVPLKASAGYLDNLTLSAARASTVYRIMRGCQPSLQTIANPQGLPVVGVAGYADLRPVFAANPRDSRNRRIDLRIMMEAVEIGKITERPIESL